RCNDRATYVTGLYISREHNFAGNAINFADCINDTNAAVFSTNLSTIPPAYEFSNEYRKIFVPTSIDFVVPEYLTLTAVKIAVTLPDGFNEERIITVPNVNNASYTIDETTLSNVLKQILGSDVDYLNEYAELKITPVVELDACALTFDDAQQRVQIT